MYIEVSKMILLILQHFHPTRLEGTDQRRMFIQHFKAPAQARARKVQRFLSQPFHVAEAFTGLKGVLVPIEETIRGFNMIMDGEVDEYPEAAFNLVGTIEDAIEKGKKLLAQAQG